MIRASSSSFLPLVASALLAVACGSVAGLPPPESGDGSADVDADPTPPGADGAATDATTSGPDGGAADATKGASEDAESPGDTGNPIDGADATLLDGANDASPADATTLDAEATKDAPTTDSTLSDSGEDAGVGDASVLDAAEASADASPPFDANGPGFPTLDAGGCVIPSSAWTVTPPPSPPLPPEAAPTSDSMINVALTVNDILYDPYTRLLYASVPSRFGANGNSIARIDPTTGAILGTVFVGSEPDVLAESADGQYLYVGLDGAAAIARYNLATQTPDLQFSLVPATRAIGANQALSIQVLPNSPHAILVASGTYGYYISSVAIYDDGVPRGNVLTNQMTSSVVATGGDGLAFESWGYERDDLYVLCLNPGGVYAARQVLPELETGSSAPAHAYSGGLFYSPSGEVIDPVNASVMGAYGSMGPFVLEPGVGRVYFLGSAAVDGSYLPGIIAYDQAHFTPVGTAVFPGVTNADTNIRLVRWGRYGFAFVSNSQGAQISIVRTPIVPVQP